MEVNRVYNEDCLGERGICLIPDGSVDMILADIPYGTTRNHWDSVLPLELLWMEYLRIIKTNGAIVLTAQTPFDKILGTSNIEMLRYEWIWEKTKPTGHLNAKKMPMKAHENVLVFYKNLPTYNPQKTYGHNPVNKFTKHTTDGSNYGKTQIGISGGGQTDRYPRSVLKFPADKKKFHPTQKPIALFEYLIRTYSNPGEIVVDNCIGGGTTAIACMNTGRNFIGFEVDEKYASVAENRIAEHMRKGELR